MVFYGKSNYWLDFNSSYIIFYLDKVAYSCMTVCFSIHAVTAVSCFYFQFMLSQCGYLFDECLLHNRAGALEVGDEGRSLRRLKGDLWCDGGEGR